MLSALKLNSQERDMKKVVLLLTIAFCTAIATTPATAGTIIFNGGGPDHGGFLYSDTNNGFITASAEDFVLSSGASTVGGATWWGACAQPADCSSASFTVDFYTNASGQPGSLIQSYSVGDANRTATGSLIAGTFTEYEYSTTFAPLVLSPGVSYWVAFVNSTPGGTWGWETTSAGDGDGHAYFEKPLGAWGTDPGFGPYLAQDLAYNLTAPDTTPVPEPATLSFLGLGLFAAARRNRRNTR